MLAAAREASPVRAKASLQRLRVLVELARVGRSEQARVEDRGLPDAAHRARQHIAARFDPAAPAALGLLGDGVHAGGQALRARLGLRIDRVGERL